MRKIISSTLGLAIFFALTFTITPPVSAQFGSLTTTPTPTLTSTPTATPTLRIGSPGGATDAATSPSAGNALPTFIILVSSLALLGLGVLTWKIRPSSEKP